MTAALQLEQAHRPADAPRWRPVVVASNPPGGCGRQGPAGRDARAQHSSRHPAVAARRRHQLRARRRRVTLGALVIAGLVALALPWGGAGGHPLVTPGSVLAGAAVSPDRVYVVQPGDTMWSIAERLDPDGDPRPIVAQLEAQVGSDTLQPGERIHLP